jgi:hypothetical protein
LWQGGSWAAAGSASGERTTPTQAGRRTPPTQAGRQAGRPAGKNNTWRHPARCGCALYPAVPTGALPACGQRPRGWWRAARRTRPGAGGQLSVQVAQMPGLAGARWHRRRWWVVAALPAGIGAGSEGLWCSSFCPAPGPSGRWRARRHPPAACSGAAGRAPAGPARSQSRGLRLRRQRRHAQTGGRRFHAMAWPLRHMIVCPVVPSRTTGRRHTLRVGLCLASNAQTSPARSYSIQPNPTP